MSLRKALKPRVAFPSEEAALKVMYLALRNVIRKWEPFNPLEGGAELLHPPLGRPHPCGKRNVAEFPSPGSPSIRPAATTVKGLRFAPMNALKNARP